MGITVEQLQKSFFKYNGYLEKKTNAHLDDLTANAGLNNWTRFGRDYNILMKTSGFNGVPWCAEFMSIGTVEAFGNLEQAKEFLCGNLYASCTQLYNAFKKNGRVFTYPKIGDFVIYKNSKGTICHIGWVYAYDGSKIYTIEGNTSGGSTLISNGGGVATKSYPIGYSRIKGYCRPTYESNTIVQSPKVAETTFTYTQAQFVTDVKQALGLSNSATLAQVLAKTPTVSIVFNKKHKVVKAIQKMYTSLGLDVGDVDGIYGSLCNVGTKIYQRNVVGASPKNCDGVISAKCNTWKKLLGL